MHGDKYLVDVMYTNISSTEMLCSHNPIPRSIFFFFHLRIILFGRPY
jgi:hypothetical protein